MIQKKWIKILVVIVLLLTAFMAGRLATKNSFIENRNHDHQTDAKEEIWTCSMHPQIRMPKPGKCPICGMDLILLEEDDHENDQQLKLSQSAASLGEIEVTLVERKEVHHEIRMLGKIAYDERKVKVVTTRVPGRLERVYVDYTGVPVKKGEHLVSIFSPDIYTAQEELIQALNNSKSENTILKESATANLEGARERLSQWGLTANQIKEIEKRGSAKDKIVINSPISGIVIDKKALQGAYVKKETEIYTIADLRTVWVLLEAYESDLNWIRYGQAIRISVESYPGELFEGRISLIEPVLNPKTRTVRVRVHLSNKNLKLKPDMYATGVVQSVISESGKTLDNHLAGKWVSPMHPEIISSKPGNCSICGMKLVRAEKLGFAKRGENNSPPLVIPATAPLLTGKRAVVYIQIKSKDNLIYEGREVILGPRAGDYYVVLSGLNEGDAVVSKGSFKIDSELQIRAKKSMMNMETGNPQTNQHNHFPPSKTKSESKLFSKFNEQESKHLNRLYEIYFKLQVDLAHDNVKKSKNGLVTFQKKLKNIPDKIFRNHSKNYFNKWRSDLTNSLNSKSSGTLSDTRKIFKIISNYMLHLMEHHKPIDQKFYKAHCPMAFDGDGADWLQNHEHVNNPYFGSNMLDCGNIDLISSTTKFSSH